MADVNIGCIYLLDLPDKQKLTDAFNYHLPICCMASITGKLKDVDSWIRNRLRYCIWHQWKKPDRRRKNMMRLGVDALHAYVWSRSRKGGWAITQSPVLTTTITLERLQNRGYESMLDYYEKVSPQLNEPLYARPVREFIPPQAEVV